MKIKRPLCIASVLFLAVQAVIAGGFQNAKDLKPSALEQTAGEGDRITVAGTVYRREEKPEYQVYYLTDNHVRLEDSITKSEINEDSEILVYIRRQDSEITVKEENEKEKSRKEKNTGKICIGNTIRVSGDVGFFLEASNPGNFDRKFYYQKQGIHASLWSDGAEIVGSKVHPVREWLAVLRSRWKSLLVDALGESYGNSMSAILLGDKSGLDPDTKTLFQKSGIGHILAISGLHMSFIGMGLYRLLRKAGAGFAPAGIAGIVLLTLYTLMIGAGVSSLRAIVMYVVRMGAEITGRDYDLPTSLSLAAAVIVLWQPLYLFDAGFQLSFGAILGIAMVVPVLENCPWIPKFLASGMAIQITLLPLMLYYYFELPVWSVLLNLLVIPLMSAVLGAGLAGSVLFLIFPGGGTCLLQICKWILRLYETGCEWSMELPCGRLVTGQPPVWLIILYYIVLAVLCYAGRRTCADTENKQTGRKQADRQHTGGGKAGNSRLIPGILLFQAVLFGVLTANAHGRAGEVKVVMLDVGQGDCLYIRTPDGRHCLVDGGSTDVKNVGTYRLEPFLESQGVGTLDYVFLSHGDEDHVGGIRELLENQKLGVRIDTLVLPEERVLDETLLGLAKLARQNNTRVVTMQEGEILTGRDYAKADGEAAFAICCLAPGHEYSGESGNAASMVLALQYGAFDMLFTGDVEGEGEGLLTEKLDSQKYDVLKVAHHGSKNSTSEEFLQSVSPEIALISAGKENRYGHPHEETLLRLETCGCQIYNTQDCGAVTVVSDGEVMRVERYVK